ncbi:substrate-binding domain-containing protein [bacterium]|nr:substrate-binding domain-containing protein [bacterium]
MKINKNSPLPRYYQLMSIIKRRASRLKAGDRIDTVQELCSKYKLSKSTVEKAVSELVKQNILVSEVGRGTFVQSSTYTEKRSYNKNIALFLNSTYSSGSSKSGNMGFYGDLLEKLHESLNKENFNVKHYFLKDGNLSKLRLKNDDLKNMLGTIFVGTYSGDNKALFKTIPTVFVGCEINNRNTISIVSKNVSGGNEATRYLLKLGFRKIGFIGDNQPNYKLRYQGYCEALNSAKIPINDKIVWFDYNKANRDLGETPSIVDALFCCADWITLRVVNSLHKNGIDIPKDISIVSYDDTDILTHIEPLITSISIDRAEMATKAIDALQMMIKNGKNTGKVMEVSTKLVVRDSTSNFAKEVSEKC